MSLRLLFWLLFVLWLVLRVWGYWPSAPASPYWRPWGADILLVVLVFLVGWRIFGFIIAG